MNLSVFFMTSYIFLILEVCVAKTQENDGKSNGNNKQVGRESAVLCRSHFNEVSYLPKIVKKMSHTTGMTHWIPIKWNLLLFFLASGNDDNW